MRWVRRLLGVGLLVGTWWVGWRFVSENQQLVSINYVVGQGAEVALWKAILLSFAVGAGLVACFTLWTSARNGLVARRYRKELGGLEAEIHQLRNLPLAPAPDVPVRPAAGVPSARSATGRDT